MKNVMLSLYFLIFIFMSRIALLLSIGAGNSGLRLS